MVVAHLLLLGLEKKFIAKISKLLLDIINLFLILMEEINIISFFREKTFVLMVDRLVCKQVHLRKTTLQLMELEDLLQLVIRRCIRAIRTDISSC